LRANLETLAARGVRFVEPGEGYLACGWLGKGRLAEVPVIVEAALGALARRRALAGTTVLVTAGPTIEDIDPVRFVSNRSSGRMGYRVAEAARDRGARVVLVAGPTSLPEPSGIEVVHVRSAEQMAAAVERGAQDAAVVVMAAAVADYRPATVAPRKLKKGESGTTLELVPTTDILRGLGQRKGSRFLVGFAAETDALADNARKKLAEKRLDLIVANDVSRAGAGFGAETNQATLLDAAGGVVEVPRVSKRELAERIWDRVLELTALNHKDTKNTKNTRGTKGTKGAKGREGRKGKDGGMRRARSS
jgi:phosphopantothenoylcysteine decarboxylase/phosphopantothenate--cysteine ligase